MIYSCSVNLYISLISIPNPARVPPNHRKKSNPSLKQASNKSAKKTICCSSENVNRHRASKSRRNHPKSGRGEVAWLAYRPVEPGARVRIPASALNIQKGRASCAQGSVLEETSRRNLPLTYKARTV